MEWFHVFHFTNIRVLLLVDGTSKDFNLFKLLHLIVFWDKEIWSLMVVLDRSRDDSLQTKLELQPVVWNVSLVEPKCHAVSRLRLAHFNNTTGWEVSQFFNAFLCLLVWFKVFNITYTCPHNSGKKNKDI